MPLADRDLPARAAGPADPTLTEEKLKHMVTAAADGINKVLRSTSDLELQAELSQAKDDLLRDLNESTTEEADDESSHMERVARSIQTQYDIGRGWSVGVEGLKYQSRDDRFTFNVKPTLSGIKPTGAAASFTWRF